MLTERGMVGVIASRGVADPSQAGHRWVIEHPHAWANRYGKLRWCTERRSVVVEFWLALALTAVPERRLAQALRTCFATSISILELVGSLWAR